MSRIGKYLVGFLASVSLVAAANASAIYLPLSGVFPGSEQVTPNLVLNGDFEADNSQVPLPTDWGTRVANVYSIPQNLLTGWLGTHVSDVDSSSQIAIADTNNGLGGLYTTGGYSQTIAVTPGADYVLSAYLWNFSGDPQAAPLVTADVHADIPGLTDLTIVSADPNGAGGYFAYSAFNTGVNNSITVRIRYDNAAGATGDNVVAVWDNIAVTPAASFQQPLAVPEPTAAACLAAGGFLLASTRNRQSRVLRVFGADGAAHP